MLTETHSDRVVDPRLFIARPILPVSISGVPACLRRPGRWGAPGAECAPGEAPTGREGPTATETSAGPPPPEEPKVPPPGETAVGKTSDQLEEEAATVVPPAWLSVAVGHVARREIGMVRALHALVAFHLTNEAAISD